MKIIKDGKKTVYKCGRMLDEKKPARRKKRPPVEEPEVTYMEVTENGTEE